MTEKVHATELSVSSVLIQLILMLNIGFDLGMLPRKVFTMLVIMAVATSLMTGPLLQRLLPLVGRRPAWFIEHRSAAGVCP